MSDAPDDAGVLQDLFAVIPQFPDHHATSGPVWRLWNNAARRSIAALFRGTDSRMVPFGPFGDLSFPYVEMGAISSLELFGLDELILFSFYDRSRGRYRRIADFGANIGLHSMILARCGFEVRSFEPDPRHVDLFRRTMSLNGTVADLHEAAVSIESGRMDFVRVLGNTTGSHLAGAKANPYGELERFSVIVEAAGPHLAWADLAKIDIEGHEAALVCGLPADTWLTTDAVMEVGTPENARMIFEHLVNSPVNLFSQKIGWKRVGSVEDLPTSHRDGSLFLSGKPRMPW